MKRVILGFRYLPILGTMFISNAQRFQPGRKHRSDELNLLRTHSLKDKCSLKGLSLSLTSSAKVVTPGEDPLQTDKPVDTVSISTIKLD
jgi:hypothetical protein